MVYSVNPLFPLILIFTQQQKIRISVIKTHQKHKFSLPDNLTFLNMAYMSPQLKVSELVGMEGLTRKNNPTQFNKQYFFDDVDKLRATFGQVINASAHQIAVIPSVSYGIANVSNNINWKPNGEILCLTDQFPSNYYSWQRAAEKENQKLKIIGPSASASNRVSSWNQNILEAITSDTSVVTMSHVHWADGSLYDLKQISQHCQKHDVYLIIDGTQSVGALPLDIREIPVDALIVGGYKWLLGHYGLGVAYYSERFNQGIPIEDNWINRKDSDDFQNLVNYQDQYREGAARYSVGEQSNFIQVPVLQAGLEQILEWGVENIQAYCTDLHKNLIRNLQGTPYRVPDVGDSSSHLTSIRISDELDMEQIKQTLTENNIHVSYRGDAMRISFYVFNTEADVMKLVDVLGNLV